MVFVKRKTVQSTPWVNQVALLPYVLRRCGPFEDIVGANISKYECPIFGNMEGPSVVDSKAGLPDIGIFYSFRLS